MTLTKLLPSMLITYLDPNVSFLSLRGAIFYLQQRDIRLSRLLFSLLLTFSLVRMVDAGPRLVWMKLDRQALKCLLDVC